MSLDLAMTSLKTCTKKETMDKLDFIKIKNHCSAKDTVERMRQATEDCWEIFANDTSDQGMVSKICKELLQLNNKKMNNPALKTGKISEQTPHQRIYEDSK